MFTQSWVRRNLQLRVERVGSDEDRLQRLVSLVRGEIGDSVSSARDRKSQEGEEEDDQDDDGGEDDDSDEDGDTRALAKADIIVYTSTKKECDVLAERLRAEGVLAAAYHAGLGLGERERTQRKFMRGGGLRVIVSTVAFGMGVDKSDVRSVVHYRMPRAIEDYIQEVGRAGRRRADGVVLRAL